MRPPESRAIFCLYVCIYVYIYILFLETESDSFNRFCLRTTDKVKEPEKQGKPHLEGGSWPNVVFPGKVAWLAQRMNGIGDREERAMLNTKERQSSHAGMGKMTPSLGIGRLETKCNVSNLLWCSFD